MVGKMKTDLETLEQQVLKLAMRAEALHSSNQRLKAENDALKAEQAKQKEDHQKAVDELSEALLVQVGRLKEDLQAKIDSLIEEKQQYRDLLAASAAKLQDVIRRLPADEALNEGDVV